MKDIQHLPAPEDRSRVESGPVQFGDDWPGIFFRGDDALATAMYLQYVLDNQKTEVTTDMIAVVAIERLQKLLSSCRV